MKPHTFYRYEDNWTKWEYGIYVLEPLEFSLLKETPCGYWITDKKVPGKWSISWLEKPKWVSKTSKKRFAYPTKEEALESLRRRKLRQREIIKSALRFIEETLQLCRTEKEKLLGETKN